MRKLRALMLRLYGTFRANEADCEIAAELESHLQMHIEDNVRSGLSPEEARRQALIHLGGLEQTKESWRERRGLPWLETWWQDISFALRMLRKNPGFAAAAILTMALGIGANTAIFSIVKTVLLAPLPYRDANRIVTVWTASPRTGGQPQASSAGDFAIWKQRSGVFEDLAPSYDREMTLTGHGAPQFLLGYAVSANYLRILGVEPSIGRFYTDQEDRPGGPKAVLLSDRIWRTAFHSDPAEVGRTISLDGTPYTVLGVMPPRFNYPTEVDIWTPVAMAPAAFDDFNHTYVRILGRLKPAVNPAAAQKALNVLEAQVAARHPDTDSGNRVVLTPLREQLDGDIRGPLLILMGAVGLVLLIACANIACLTLVRNASRRKEVAVRLALGVARVRLLRQFVTESLLLAAMGGAAGLALALAGTRLLVAIFPNDVENLRIPKVTAIPIDGGVLLFALAVTLLTGFLCGIIPAMKAARTDSGDAMKEQGRGSTASQGSNRARTAIVVAELALSLTLLTAAGLVVASFQRVAGANLGFQPQHVLSLQIFLSPDRYGSRNPGKKSAFVAEVVRRMSALPGVQAAGATNYLPLSGFGGTTDFLLRGQGQARAGQAPSADNRVITPAYLRTMGIPLLRGRALTEADRTGAAQVAMINQTLARQYFRDRDPVGEELNLGTGEKPDWWRIVGVTGDVRALGQDQPIHPDIYTDFDQQPDSIVAFVVRTAADPAAMVKTAERTLWSVDPDLPVFRAISMDALASQTLALRRASSLLISGFAVLALVLASIGIYGVMAYSVAQRTQEIGVRMALGAERADVLRLVIRLGCQLTLTGVVIGLAGALASTRLLASLLYEVSAMNPLIFSLTAALLAAVGILASYLPARRAASIDPIQALRTE
jgi:putative ABC transport system permease protein